MRLVRVGAAVMNQTPLDWDNNLKNILASLEAAREAGVGVLCLPEMCIPGYGCEDAFHSPGLIDTCMELLGEILPHTRGLAACIGLPLRYQNGLFNAAAMVTDGELVGFVCKQHLAGDGLHYEPRWFKRWHAGVQAEVTALGRRVPAGDIHFDVGGIRVGFEICEDAWVAVRPGGALAQRGVDIILNPSASHFAFGKLDVRKRFVIEGSRAFGVSYVYTNLLGNEAGRAIYDGGALIASGGELLTAGPRFGYDDWHLTHCVVDIERTRMVQMRTASFRPELDGDESDCLPVPFEWPTCPPEATRCELPTWETGPHPKKEEFTRAVGLALFDYLRKSRSRGFLVSLSGGADSTAVSCLIGAMAELAVAGLGLDGVKERLAYIGEGVTKTKNPEDLVGALLTCVYQATRNSSERTQNAAETVAGALGARFYNLDVDALVSGYTGLVEGALGRELRWDRDDIALQNIQARVRAPGIWMLANVTGALLLATSNRSEAAVGYATMDGDTCGGVSPIAGIDKAFLREWLSWIETVGSEGYGPVPALEVVTSQTPTAELRPLEKHQTDEDDLMPYPILDAIERAAIRDKKTPLGCYERMRGELPAISAGQMAAWVERFFVLWCRNQWKRERYAPSFHVDDENLDPKTWCRFPILSGGFRRELAALRVRAKEDMAKELRG